VLGEGILSLAFQPSLSLDVTRFINEENVACSLIFDDCFLFSLVSMVALYIG